MRVIVAVNRISEIGVRQTTALIIAALVRRSVPVFLIDIDSFEGPSLDSESTFPDPMAAVEVLGLSDSDSVSTFCNSNPARHDLAISNQDLVLIRTNPGRDLQRARQHSVFLDRCKRFKASGGTVVNDPDALDYFSSKASLVEIDEAYRPAMQIGKDAEAIARFVKQSQADCIVKPVAGSRGTDVIRVNWDDVDLIDRIKATFQGREMIVQHFITGQIGDSRVIVLNGEIMEHQDHAVGISRLPAAGDFRGNIHAGGTAQPLALSGSARLAVQHAAKQLIRRGIWMAGVDIVSDQVIEMYVFSPGGVYPANQFANLDFSDAIVASFLGTYSQP